MIKSKTKLLYNVLTICFIFFILFQFFIGKDKSLYNKQDQQFRGIVQKFKVDGTRLTVELKAKEKLMVYYYFQTKKEKEDIQKYLKLGSTIRFSGTLEKPSKNRNLYGFNYQKYLLSKNIHWFLNAEGIKIEKRKIPFFYQIKNHIVNRINHFRYKDYLQLFILGENDLDQEIKNSYSNNGISHLFAISGMHISLLTLLLSKVLHLIIKQKMIITIFIILFLLFFCFLTDFSPSVLRASTMYILCDLKFLKNISREKIIIFIFLSMLCINPYYIYHLGFMFSYVISFFLIYFHSLIGLHSNYFKQLFLVSLICFIVSIPIMIYQFHSINLFSICCNLFFVPFVSFIVFPLALLTFLFPILEPIFGYSIDLLQAISLLAEKISFLTFVFRHPPFILILFYYLLIFLSFKHHIFFIFLFIITLIIHNFWNYFDSNLIISMIDIGQGDSILIKLPNNQGNILFDTGGKIEYTKEKWQKKKKETNLAMQTIIPYLKAEGIKKLDYLVLTHADFDHAGESIHLIQNYKIRHIVMNSGNDTKLEKQIIAISKKENIQISEINQSTIKIGDTKFYFLNQKDISNENEDSLITYMRIRNRNILLMGDAGEKSEQYLLNEYNLPKMDILKVGHHGSKYSSSLSFIKTIKPKISLISAGVNNRFHHPNQETIKRLSMVDSKIYVTSNQGMIRVSLNRNMNIQTAF